MSIENKINESDNLINTYLWHFGLGRINEKYISKLYRDGYLESINFESFDKCKSCMLGKLIKFPFTDKEERATQLLGLIHSDVCGSVSITARGGFSHFTFTNDHSRYGYVDEIKHETVEKINEFKLEVDK